MKHRITTPDGTRIPIEDIGPYQAYSYNYESPTVIIERRGVYGVKGDLIVKFNTPEERDAFLARLDAYFQEIP
jgi:hypothetical protein